MIGIKSILMFRIGEFEQTYSVTVTVSDISFESVPGYCVWKFSK